MSGSAKSDPLIEPIEELVSPAGDGQNAEAFVKHLLSTASAQEVRSFFFYVSLRLAAGRAKLPSVKASPKASRRKVASAATKATTTTKRSARK